MKIIQSEKFFICRLSTKQTINETTGEKALVRNKIATCGEFTDLLAIKQFYNDSGKYVETSLQFCHEPDMVLQITIHSSKDRNQEHHTVLFKKV